MENTELHGQKLAILSRLIKESSLSLEEALVLLQDEPEEEVVEPTPVTSPWTSQPTIFPNWGGTRINTPVSPGTIRFSTSSSYGNVGIGTINPTTSLTVNNTADADLNN